MDELRAKIMSIIEDADLERGVDGSIGVLLTTDRIMDLVAEYVSDVVHYELAGSDK
jgi:hypothetical protein